MPNLTPPRLPTDPLLAEMLKTLTPKWGWFVGLGLVLLVLGVVASLHVLLAAMVSVWFIGLMMIIGGVAQLFHAWRTRPWADRKSTRLNSSHVAISYAVFCLKKKNNQT